MLFFDDCNWGNHCRMVANACRNSDTGKPVVTHETPRGIQESDWRQGLEKFAKSVSK